MSADEQNSLGVTPNSAAESAQHIWSAPETYAKDLVPNVSRFARPPELLGAVSASGIRLPLEQMDEPVLIEAVRYWQQIAGDGIPSRRAIDPAALGARVLPFIFLADILPEEPRFRFRLAGFAIEERFGNLKGKTLEALNLGAELPQIKSQYNDAVLERAPIYCTHSFVTREGRQRNYKRVVMPLCSNSDEIDGLLGAIVFSPYRTP